MEIVADTIIRQFTTRKPGTGLQDADNLPVGTVYKNGVLTGITVTVTNISTGLYKASFVAAAGVGADQFVIGDNWALHIAATVDSEPDNEAIAQGTFDTKRVGALQDIAAGAPMTLTAAYDAAKTASQFDTSTDEVNIGAVKGVAVADVDDFKADVSGLALETTSNAIGLICASIKTQTDKLSFSGSNVQSRVADKGVLNDIAAGADMGLTVAAVTSVVSGVFAKTGLIDDSEASTFGEQLNWLFSRLLGKGVKSTTEISGQVKIEHKDAGNPNGDTKVTILADSEKREVTLS